jgi:hypothetical protein
MFEGKEEKYRVAFIFYVKAKSYEEANEKVKTLRIEDADEKTVTKFKHVK